MAPDPYRYFRVEAREILDELSRGAMALERQPLPPDLVSKLFRCAHTLKGAARVVKLPDIAERCHRIEDALTPLRDGGAAASHALVDELLALVDQIEGLLASLGGGGAATAVKAEPAPGPVSAPAPQVDAAEIDAVLENLSELGVELGGLRASSERLERGVDLAGLLVRQLSGAGTETARALAETLQRELATVRASLEGGVDRLDRELRQARHGAETVRLIPVSSVFAVLERAARDTALSIEREVEFVSVGGEVRVGAPVLARIQPALIQLVRNAIAHGIESARERAALGKKGAGRVTVAIERQGGAAVFRCTDDGRGFNLEAVRQVLVRRGLLDERATGLGSDDLLQILLRGGVSTSHDVTQLSGRGVGLDVARDAATRLGGEIDVRTEPGRGTTITLTVPISFTSLPALLVESAGTVAAIPLEGVRSTTRILPDALVHEPDVTRLRLPRGPVPFAPLSDSLAGRSAGSSTAPRCAVEIVAGQEVAAIGVDRLLGTSNIVLRSLPDLAPVEPVVAGTWLDGEGTPQLVVDPSGLIAALKNGEFGRAAPESKRRLPVLVVDDSLTTRMLEQSILESAGYEVELAVSAEEGLEKARARAFGLFLVDVEMPGMDGFTFVERIRADPALKAKPAILVTSRNAPEDRRRGAAVGANAYVVKSEFDQNRLLETIRSLTGEA
jgi:two-component system, chemotaxis family, sensor kinase CheA